MGLSDAVNDWKDLISNIPLQYYAVLIKKYNFFVFRGALCGTKNSGF
ncbi:MAG: hypothetical protein JWP81_4468 [Ferruginibacter sp.]|nr:hypothetical protein [Ferruginibacter sp.]